MQSFQDSIAEAAKNKSTFLDLLQQPGLRRALVRGLGSVVLQQLSGINVVNSYAQNIFELAGESFLSTSEATIVVGAILLASAGVGVTLTHRFGIRRMMAVSAAGMMVFLVSIETVP